MKTGVVRDRRYLEHEMGSFHPESPRRLEAIYRMLEENPSFNFFSINPRPASEEEVALVHSPSYVRLIRETAGRERAYLDPDTSTCPRSYEVALLAAGGLLKAADLIMEGEIQNAFALVRPPGHHAEASQARGFCIFNNIAIAAQYLIKAHGLKRILIVDWDIHHGNGTQNSFYTRKDILYFSTHQYPHYPGTGYWDEVGWEEGEGYSINIPLSGGKSDEDYFFIYHTLLPPLAAKFHPEFILVSAGFDTFAGDPLGGMHVTIDGFAALASELRAQAEKLCHGRILLTLEGGYNLFALQDGVKAVLLELEGRGKSPSFQGKIQAVTERELAPVLRVLEKYWGWF